MILQKLRRHTVLPPFPGPFPALSAISPTFHSRRSQNVVVHPSQHNSKIPYSRHLLLAIHMRSPNYSPESSFASSSRFSFINYNSCENSKLGNDITTTCNDLVYSSNSFESGSSLESEELESKENMKNSYNRRDQDYGTTEIVDRRKNVQKEVTVMTIGSKSKAHMLVQAPPKFPYHVAKMCPNTDLKKRTKSAQRYRIQDPRTGGLFHRIKPRPIMMDKSKFPVNSLKKRSSNLQDRSPDNFQGRYVPFVHDDDNFLVFSPSVLSSKAGVIGKSSKFNFFNRKKFLSNDHNREDNGKQAKFFGTLVRKIRKLREKNDDGRALSPVEDRDHMLNSVVCDAESIEILSAGPETKWRKSVPLQLESMTLPKEQIDAYEVECEAETDNTAKQFFKSRSRPKSSNLTFHVKAEESEIDQNDAGKSLSKKELQKFKESKQGSESKLGVLVRKTKLGISRKFSNNKGSDIPTISKHLKTNCEELHINEEGGVTNTKIVYSTFGGNPIETMKIIQVNEDIVPSPESFNVLVQIETCTVSRMDAKIRHGEMGLPKVPLNDSITPGVDVVGKVLMCGDSATVIHGVNNGDTVASLVGCGGNAKYINLNAVQLVRVPRGVASISASIVIESYLPAFQALLLKVSKEDRYNPSILNGKKVLILGGITTVGQALIELCLLLGASQVYGTAITKHHKLIVSLGAIPVEIGPETWPEDMNEQIDIAVDPSNFAVSKETLKVMKQDGKLVCFGRGGDIDKFAGPVLDTFPGLFNIKSLYNVFDEWMENLEGSKGDLSYLFGLLKQNRIDPQLAGTLRLNKVSDAHVVLDGKRRIQGTFVCLPFEKK